MSYAYNIQAPKKATNLTINSELLAKAKSYKINLSKSFEQHLSALVKEYEANQWKKENAQAIDEYNNRVEESGVFSNGLRRF